MIALLIAGGVSLAVSLVGTRFLIMWLIDHRVGQPIREEGPKQHATKAGTPTMGGIAIVVAVATGYGVAHVRQAWCSRARGSSCCSSRSAPAASAWSTTSSRCATSATSA